MAGHHDGQGVAGARAARSANRLRVASRLRDRGIAGGLSVTDLRQVRKDRAAEAVRQLQIERHVERATSPGEVLLDLARDAVQARGRSQDARAHVAGEAFQHEVVVLARVRDSYEALRRGRQQQGAHRGIDGAVRDVEKTRGVRGVHQAPMQPAVGFVVDRWQRGEQIPLVRHRDSPFGNLFRNVAIPSAAARRAAS